MKVKVIPVGRPAGHQCYRFTLAKLRDAWSDLTGKQSASREKLSSLSAFGVEIDYDGDIADTPKKEPTGILPE